MFQHEHSVASVTAMPTRVPPPGGSTAPHLPPLTVGEKNAALHRIGAVHFGPACPICTGRES